MYCYMLFLHTAPGVYKKYPHGPYFGDYLREDQARSVGKIRVNQGAAISYHIQAFRTMS